MANLSVVIPTKNAGPEFDRTLSSLACQVIDAEVEVIVIDSGSEDETLSIAQRHNAKVIQIDPRAFNHGETRNMAIRQAVGEFVVLTVQDAVPSDKAWLSRFLSWFRRDDGIAGVFGKQTARPDADLLAAWEVEAHNRIFDKGARVKSLPSREDFLRCDFMERFDLALFDNVCSAIRKSVWEKFPFRRAEFAEDLEWCLEVMRAGYKIVHEPGATVLHSHNRPALYRFKRHFVTTKRVMEVLEADAEDFSQFTDSSMLSDLLAFAAQIQGLLASVEDANQRKELQADGFSLQSFGVDEDFGKKDLGRLLEALRKAKARVTSLMTQPSASAPTVPLDVDRLRGSFSSTMKELNQKYPTLGCEDLRFLIANVAARAAGDVLSKYYFWCERNQKLSETMKILGASLSQGI